MPLMNFCTHGYRVATRGPILSSAHHIPWVGSYKRTDPILCTPCTMGRWLQEDMILSSAHNMYHGMDPLIVEKLERTTSEQRTSCIGPIVILPLRRGQPLQGTRVTLPNLSLVERLLCSTSCPSCSIAPTLNPQIKSCIYNYRAQCCFGRENGVFGERKGFGRDSFGNLKVSHNNCYNNTATREGLQAWRQASQQYTSNSPSLTPL